MLKKAAGIILILTLSYGGLYFSDLQDKQLADSVLRLHVIANSDDPADQMLKLTVKDEIVTMMREEFTTVDYAAEAEELARRRIPAMKDLAEQKIISSGYDYPVKVYVGEYDFPAKSYGNMVFPQGKYQAVRVIIGEGQGKNWWCVLFPPLCMVSSKDKGLSLDSPEEAQVSFKCLELLNQGVKLVSNKTVK